MCPSLQLFGPRPMNRHMDRHTNRYMNPSMNKPTRRGWRIAALCGASLAVLLSATPSVLAADKDKPKAKWPRLFTAAGHKVLINQPQVVSWKDYLKLKVRVAVAVTPKGEETETWANIESSMSTISNTEAHEVTLYNIKRDKVTWQIAYGKKATDALKSALEAGFPKGPMQVSLDRLVAYIKKPQVTPKKGAKAPKFNFDPPKIYVRHRPAVLLLIDGKPAKGKIPNTPLSMVLNTRFDVFFVEQLGLYYLRLGQSWMESSDLKAWRVSRQVPAAFGKLPKEPRFEETRKAFPPKPLKKPPEVLVDYGQAALLQTNGPPEFGAIKGTKILYAKNSEQDLFFLPGENRTYVLLAGRWFSAPGLEGPWKGHPEGPPKEFAKIPADSPKGSVLSAVPGTVQATEAVVMAQVPHQASVKKDTTIKITYDGKPKFVPIKGTTMLYAENTSSDVILSNNVYYACVNGVWFMSKTAEGPYKVATKVDKRIYTIPADSPKHKVTYVYVYDTSPDYVVVGYTAAYMGVFVATTTMMTAAVIWGTGYRYHYRYGYYHHYHRYGYRGGYYGGYYGRTYGMGAAHYNPRMGGYQRRSFSSGYVNGRPVVATSVRGGNAYSSWGKGTVAGPHRAVQGASYRNSRGSAAGFRSTTGARGAKVNTRAGSGYVVRDRRGNVYAGSNGKVHRKSNNGWSTYDANKRSRTTSANRSKAANRGSSGFQRSSSAPRGMNNAHLSRQRGNSNHNKFQRSRSSSRSGGWKGRGGSRSGSRSRGGRRGGRRR